MIPPHREAEGVDEICRRIAPKVSQGDLRSGYNHRLIYVSKGEGQSCTRVPHRIRSVQHNERIKLVIRFLNLSSECRPIFRCDIGTVDVEELRDFRLNLDVPIFLYHFRRILDNGNKAVWVRFYGFGNLALRNVTRNRPSGKYNEYSFLRVYIHKFLINL